MEKEVLGSYFFNHPRQLFFAVVAALILIVILFAWNIVLTILVVKNSKKKSVVKCPECGGENISVMKTSANEGNKLYNVCQDCGKKWEIVKS